MHKSAPAQLLVVVMGVTPGGKADIPSTLSRTAARRGQPSAVQVLLNGEAGRSDAGHPVAAARLAGGAAGGAVGAPQKSTRRVQLLQPLSDSPPVPGAAA